MKSPRSFRTAELSEELARRGHEVVVCTVQGKYDYTEYEKQTGVTMCGMKPRFATLANDGTRRRNLFDRAMFKLFEHLLFWPWCEFHFLVGKVIKENPGADLLITIAYPHSIHSGAARAKRRNPDMFPKRWIADCGDPFMLNPMMKFPGYMKRFEEMWCQGCDFITVPTEESRKGYYEQFQDKIRVIPQGFDFSKTPVAEYRKNEVPTFLFTGRVYPGERDPHSFMDYLLKYDKPYRFIMMMLEPLEEKYLTQSGGRIEYVIGKGRGDVILECSKADFLINMTNPSTIQTPSKLIDYGISGRPVLDVDNDFRDDTAFREFMAGDYHRQHVIESLDSYRIENVAGRFLDLAEQAGGGK